MRKLLVFLNAFLVFLMVFPFSVLAAPPLETIQTSVNKVIEVLRDPSLKTKSAREMKEKKIWAIIDGIFNYTELSKRTLAEHWRTFTPDQQQEFVHLFGKLLGGIYMDRIMSYTNEKVIFSKATKLSDEIVEVQSEVVTATKSIPIYYQMISKNGEWKVYDVIIEGVSLVKNYRSQFREILANKSPEEMLHILRKKVGKA
jgi:phospholipid transport system substrate-binding protein